MQRVYCIDIVFTKFNYSLYNVCGIIEAQYLYNQKFGHFEDNLSNLNVHAKLVLHHLRRAQKYIFTTVIFLNVVFILVTIMRYFVTYLVNNSNLINVPHHPEPVNSHQEDYQVRTSHKNLPQWSHNWPNINCHGFCFWMNVTLSQVVTSCHNKAILKIINEYIFAS